MGTIQHRVLTAEEIHTIGYVVDAYEDLPDPTTLSEGVSAVVADPPSIYVVVDDGGLQWLGVGGEFDMVAHAPTHATLGGDPISPASIGAVDTTDARLHTHTNLVVLETLTSYDLDALLDNATDILSVKRRIWSGV